MPLSFQHRPALIAYLTCGDPDLATTFRVAIAALEAGVDILELGVPFSDPVADGPVIQRASMRALHAKLGDVLLSYAFAERSELWIVTIPVRCLDNSEE